MRHQPRMGPGKKGLDRPAQQQNDESAEQNGHLHPGKEAEGARIQIRATAEVAAAQGETGKKSSQNTADGEGGIAQQQSEQTGPQNLVDEAGKSGEKKENQQKGIHSGSVVGRWKYTDWITIIGVHRTRVRLRQSKLRPLLIWRR